MKKYQKILFSNHGLNPAHGISKLVLLPFENFGRPYTRFPVFLRRRRKFLEFWKPNSPDIVLKILDFSKKFRESGTGIPDEI